MADQQQSLGVENAPARDEAIEEAVRNYTNALDQKTNGALKLKEAYADLKAQMTEKGLDEYRCFDINKIVRLKTREAEIKVDDPPTAV